MMDIVIIDDEQVVLDGMEMIIKDSGRKWRVVGTALDGVEGLNLIREKSPHVVITDIKMPGMDGLEMYSRLKGEFPDMIVFVFSGYAEFGLAQRAIDLGVFNYLLKPINYEEIYAAIDKAQKLIEERQRIHLEQEALRKKLSEAPKTSDNSDLSTRGLLEVRQVIGKKGCYRNRVVSQVIKYIEENYNHTVSLKEAAEKVFLNPNYLSEIFKAETGQGFSEYLKNYRIEVATHLLGRMDLRIYEIADMVGYSDAKHFSQVFKEVIGITPSEYRDVIE